MKWIRFGPGVCYEGYGEEQMDNIIEAVIGFMAGAGFAVVLFWIAGV